MRMKKLMFLGAMTLVCAGVAFAGSLNVPFFLDDAPSNGSFPPSAGTASFIAIHNNTSSGLVCAIRYTRANGDDKTPAANTFVLPANSTWSFRPVGDDSTTEGVGAAVPNMALQSGDPPAGSATISWTGGANDVQGRLTAVRATSGGGDSASFTLPPGQ